MRRALRRPPLAIVAALVVAATAAVVLTRTGSQPTEVVAAPDSVVALDPRNDRLVDAFGVGRVPTEPATGGAAVWVGVGLQQSPATRSGFAASSAWPGWIDAPAGCGANFSCRTRALQRPAVGRIRCGWRLAVGD
jgi:hypothetical protein